MADVNHSIRKHSLLSASGASRWMACTPSPRLEEKIKDTPSSSYAAEGTLAHEFGDLGLQLASGKINKKEYNTLIAEHKSDALYSTEIEVEIQKYIDFVMEKFANAKKETKDAVLLIEEVVDLTEFIKEGFGTCDANIVGNGILDIIDLKYGKGVRVDAENNPQLMLYGLGALREYDMLYDIHTVRLSIMQPRLNHISTWTISVEDLENWGLNVVKPKAKLAYAGKGVQKAGEHCKFCKVKATCATLASVNLRAIQKDFKDVHLMTHEQILDVYRKANQITDWIKSIEVYVLNEAINGNKWAGYKLVEGKSNRKWVDVDKVAKKLSEAYEDKDIFDTKIKGIGKIEKLLGKDKFKTDLAGLYVKPEGAPTLVPESDKRPEFGAQRAIQDFGEE